MNLATLTAITALSCALLIGDPQAKPARGSDMCPSILHLQDDGYASRTAKEALALSYDSPGGKFVVQYDTTGDNAVPLADLDLSGTPDWVELVAHVADSVLAEYAAMGYDTHLRTGAARYPIALVERPGGYTYVYGVTFSSGRMEIDDDFADTNFESHGEAGLRVTIAHELFHSVQFQYVTSGPTWWMEMTATFMEEVMYDPVNDYYQYLNPGYWDSVTIYEAPGEGIDYFPFGGVYPYGGAVFPIFLDERYGRAGIIAAIRDTYDDNPAGNSAAVVSALESHLARPIDEMLAEFWTWSYFTGDRAEGLSYGFEEAVGYWPAPLDSPLYAAARAANTISDVSSKTVPDTGSAAPLGAVLLRIVPDGSPGGFLLTLRDLARNDTDHQNDWSWRVAVRKSDEIIVLPQPEPSDTVWTVAVAGSNWTDAEDIVVVAANGLTSGGEVSFSVEVKYDAGITSVALTDAAPVAYRLGLNFPNPFNPSTTIPVTLVQPGAIDLTVFDAAGRYVTTLASGAYAAGGYTFTWDGMAHDGRSAGAGVYFARLTTPTFSGVRRMLLAR